MHPTAAGEDALSPPAQWPAWFDAQRAVCQQLIAEHVTMLRTADRGRSCLAEAVAYSLNQGGKRLRPILVRECCRVAGGNPAAANPAALAVECIHTFSLIHDDLPAMDDDDLRRGVPTNHKVYGEAAAILAGDWLVAHAFTLLAGPEIRPGVAAAWVRTLGTGSLRMVEGQGADIENEGTAVEGDLVEFIHLHKTAALLEACCRLGALATEAEDRAVEALGRFGRHLGVAFQIIDDLLDHESSTDKLGKRAGKDAGANKQTYPAAFGADESRRRARGEVDAALAALIPFGDRAENLAGLAAYVLTRDR